MTHDQMRKILDSLDEQATELLQNNATILPFVDEMTEFDPAKKNEIVRLLTQGLATVSRVTNEVRLTMETEIQTGMTIITGEIMFKSLIKSAKDMLAEAKSMQENLKTILQSDVTIQ